MDKVKIARIAVAAVLLAVAVGVERAFGLAPEKALFVYLVPYFVAGYDVVGEAIGGIVKGRLFNEDFLMCVATFGALGIGFLPGAQSEFPEAVMVMLLFQVGEVFEDYAEGRSRRSISALLAIRPDTARVASGDGEPVEKQAKDVKVGEEIVVAPGERVPLDGVVVAGQSSLNTSAITGESMPRPVGVGDQAVSGCVNIEGELRLRVGKSYGESTASKIIGLVEGASARKSKSETFISKFARVYTPIVVGAAVVIAVVPPLVGGGSGDVFARWLYRALVFLVVSCPCALVISVPLSFFGGIGGASRRGILIKGANYIDTLAQVGVVAFDKTGTLTSGKFRVEAVRPERLAPRELLHLAAHVERFSSHPIAIALREAFPAQYDGCSVGKIEELAGKGVRAEVNGEEVCVGNSRLMEAVGAHIPAQAAKRDEGTVVVYVAVNGEYAGCIVVADSIKPAAAATVKGLHRMGVEKVAMLTGDSDAAAQRVANAIGIDEVHSSLMPEQKVEAVERLKAQTPAGRSLAFVGDGINDAPVIATADVGIAMGGMGSDAAIEAADIVVMDDNPGKVPLAIAIARRTSAIARQNTVFAIAVKMLVLVLAALGLAGMWMAVFADVGVMVIAVANAMRTLRQPASILPPAEAAS